MSTALEIMEIVPVALSFSFRFLLPDLQRVVFPSLLLVLWCVLPVRTLSAEQLKPVWSESPFAARDLRIRSNHSTSGPLVLRFENLQPVSRKLQAESVSFLVAGSAAKPPELRITDARYKRYRGGELVEIATVADPGLQSLSQGQLARISPGGLLRQYPVYALALGRVVAVTPGTGAPDEFWVLETLEVVLDPGPPPSRTREELEKARQFRGATDQDSAAFSTALLLNPQLDPAYYQVTPSPADPEIAAWGNLLQTVRKNRPAFRLRVYKPGLYSISAETLRQALPEPASLPPADQWRLFHSGRETALHVEKSAVASGELASFVVPSTAEHNLEQVFWLFTGPPGTAHAAGSRAPARLPIRPPASTSSSTPTLARFTVTHAPPLDYHPKLQHTADTGRWYWRSIGQGKVADVSLSLPRFYSPTSAKDVSVRMAIGFEKAFRTFPGLELIVNGQDGHFTTATQSSAEFAIPGDQLLPGENQLALKASYPAADGGPEVLLQKIEISWNQPLGRFGDTDLPFGVPPTQTTAVQFAGERAESVPSSDLLYAETTSGVVVLKAADSLSFAFPEGAFAFHPRMAASSIPARSVESVVETVSPLRAGPIDYLVVAPEEFSASLAPLLSHRKAGGHTVGRVDPQQIFDYYAYGQRDPEAVRSFLTDAFYSWSAPKLRYLMLAGEASDYRGDPQLLPANSTMDVIPVFNRNRDLPRGDFKYSTIAGNDELLDLAIGRLPVRSPQELEGAVEKLLRYERDADEAKTSQWARKAEFVFDDNDEFPRVVAEIVRRSQAPPADTQLLRQSDFPYVPYLRVPGRKRSHEATGELLRRFNRGAGIMNFFGHGGPNLWSHERLLHLSDLPLLQNAPRLPFVTCASCDNAWLDFPVAPVSGSIGEQMVTRPEGGAIALLGPVAGASPYEHQSLVQYLMEGVFRRQLRRTGDLTVYAMASYWANTRSGSLLTQYILVGDPALELAIPKVLAVKVLPEVVPSGRAADIHITDASQTGNTTLVVTLRSLESGDPVFSALLEPAHSTSRTMTLPALPEGLYGLDLLPQDADTSGALAGGLLRVVDPAEPVEAPQFTSVETSSTLEADPLQPWGKAWPSAAGHSSQFHFRLANSGSKPVAGLRAVLSRTDGTTLGETLVPELAPGNDRVVSVHASAGFPEGPATAILSLMDSTTSPGTLWRGEWPFEAVPPPSLEFVPGSLRLEPSGGDFTRKKTAFVKALLRNTGSLPARNITARMRLRDPHAGSEVQTINEQRMITIPDVPPGATVPFLFRWEDTVQADDIPLYMMLSWIGPGGNTANTLVAELPGVRFGPDPNYYVKDFFVEPESPAVGTTTTLQAVVHDDKATTGGPVDVGFTLADPVSGRTQKKIVRVADLRVPTTVSAQMQLDHPYSAASVMVNSTREAEEEHLADNEAARPLAVVVPVKLTDSGQTAALSFEGAVTTNMLSLAGQGLRVQRERVATFSAGPTPELIVSRPLADESVPGNHLNDNIWSVAWGRAFAGASEQTPPLQLRVPASENVPGVLYDVALRVSGSHDWRVAKGGKFGVLVEDEQVSRTVEFTVPTGAVTKQVPIGTYDLGDGHLDVTVWQPEKQDLLVQGIELIPHLGSVVSPVYDLGEKPSKRLGELRFHVNPGDSTARCAWRAGRGAGDGAIVWSEWNRASTGRGQVKTARYLQWKCDLIPSDVAPQPLLRKTELRLQ